MAIFCSFYIDAFSVHFSLRFRALLLFGCDLCELMDERWPTFLNVVAFYVKEGHLKVTLSNVEPFYVKEDNQKVTLS